MVLPAKRNGAKACLPSIPSPLSTNHQTENTYTSVTYRQQKRQRQPQSNLMKTSTFHLIRFNPTVNVSF
jgi:hypothetical protein